MFVWFPKKGSDCSLIQNSDKAYKRVSPTPLEWIQNNEKYHRTENHESKEKYGKPRKAANSVPY